MDDVSLGRIAYEAHGGGEPWGKLRQGAARNWVNAGRAVRTAVATGAPPCGASSAVGGCTEPRGHTGMHRTAVAGWDRTLSSDAVDDVISVGGGRRIECGVRNAITGGKCTLPPGHRLDHRDSDRRERWPAADPHPVEMNAGQLTAALSRLARVGFDAYLQELNGVSGDPKPRDVEPLNRTADRLATMLRDGMRETSRLASAASCHFYGCRAWPAPETLKKAEQRAWVAFATAIALDDGGRSLRARWCGIDIPPMRDVCGNPLPGDDNGWCKRDRGHGGRCSNGSYSWQPPRGCATTRRPMHSPDTVSGRYTPEPIRTHVDDPRGLSLTYETYPGRLREMG